MAEQDILASGFGKGLSNPVDLLPPEWQRPVKAAESLKEERPAVREAEVKQAASPVKEADKPEEKTPTKSQWNEMMKAASNFLEERANDPSRNLTHIERTIMKTVGQSIMSNDVDGVSNFLQAYQGNPRDLRKAMWALAQDFKEGGLILNYDIVKQPPNGKDQGVLRIHSEHANLYRELSTNPDSPPKLRGPVVGMNDQYKPREHANLERSGDYLYGNGPYSGILDFMERFSFAAQISKKLSAKDR